MLAFLECPTSRRVELMVFVKKIREATELWRCSGCHEDHRFKGKFSDADAGCSSGRRSR